MINKNTISWIILMLLTIITAALSKMAGASILIIIVAFLKILIVSFQFMDLKKAHIAWKIGFPVLIFLIAGIIFLVERM